VENEVSVYAVNYGYPLCLHPKQLLIESRSVNLAPIVKALKTKAWKDAFLRIKKCKKRLP